MLKNFFYVIAALIVVGFVLIIGYNWGWFGGNKLADQNGVFHRNGQPVNPAARAICDEACLKAYPAGSQWAGYYYCLPGCKVGGGVVGRFSHLPSPPSPTPGGGSPPAPTGGGGGSQSAVIH